MTPSKAGKSRIKTKESKTKGKYGVMRIDLTEIVHSGGGKKDWTEYEVQKYLTSMKDMDIKSEDDKQIFKKFKSLSKASDFYRSLN